MVRCAAGVLGPDLWQGRRAPPVRGPSRWLPRLPQWLAPSNAGLASSIPISMLITYRGWGRAAREWGGAHDEQGTVTSGAPSSRCPHGGTLAPAARAGAAAWQPPYAAV